MTDQMDLAIKIAVQNQQAIRALGETQRAVSSFGRTAHNVMSGLAQMGAAAGLGEFFKSSVNQAIASQAENARVMTATIGDGAEATKNMVAVQKMAIATSSKLAVTQDQLKEGYTLARYAGLDNMTAQQATVDAAKLSIATTKSVAEAQAQMAETTRMVSASYEIFGDKTKNAQKQIDAISDSYALLQTRSNFANASELNSALTESLGASKAYGVSIAAQNAFLETLANSGKFAGVAGTAYLEVVDKMSASNKKMAGMSAAAGGDIIRELGMIEAQTRGLSNVQMTAWGKAHGFESRSIQGLGMLVGQYNKVIAANKTYSGTAAAGMGEQLFKLRSNDAADKIAIAQNNLANFKEALGTTLLPTLNRAMEAAGSLFGTLARFSEAHPTIAGIAIDFLGISAAIIAVSGVFTMLGAGTTLMYGWSVATKVATAAQWLFNAAMAANPIGIAILAAAAFAALAYEAYEHWAAVKGFFKSWGTEVLGYLEYPFLALPHAIAAAAGAVEDAAKGIAHRIARLFVGHSPIPEGPLHDLNLAAQVALSLRPGPVIAAARRLAGALALTIPLAVAAPMAPAMAMGAAGAMAPGATGRPVISVTVQNFAPQITIADAQGDPSTLATKMIAALKVNNLQLARELAAAIEAELARRARGNF